jgi:uncharacterized protein (DUF1015 family)
MATIKAFRGTRYSASAGKLAELCCPPYDIISESERNALLRTNPHNIIRLELPRSYKDGEENADLESYAEAGRTLNEWVVNGTLVDDGDENIYVYEFSFENEGEIRAVKGFVALVKLEEFSKGIVLPHEETLSKAKTDRFNLMTETGCNFSQIYSLYQDPDNTGLAVLDSATSGAPTTEFTDSDNVTHRMWAVSDTDVIGKIAALTADKRVYIADGHHRYETALAYRDAVASGEVKPPEGLSATADSVPMMLVNMENPGLTVWPTHRIVRDLPDFDCGAVLAKCAEYFDITEHDSLPCFADRTNAFVLYHAGKYTLMVLKEKHIMDSILADKDVSLRYLDVSVLHSLVLERLFGIDKENMAAQRNLTYTRVFDEAIEAVDSGAANCAFLLNSTPIAEISNVASSGGKMPQKSTYFYPKLTTGLVMNRIFK